MALGILLLVSWITLCFLNLRWIKGGVLSCFMPPSSQSQSTEELRCPAGMTSRCSASTTKLMRINDAPCLMLSKVYRFLPRRWRKKLIFGEAKKSKAMCIRGFSLVASAKGAPYHCFGVYLIKSRWVEWLDSAVTCSKALRFRMQEKSQYYYTTESTTQLSPTSTQWPVTGKYRNQREWKWGKEI